MNEVDRIIALLGSDSIEKRIAASIVLGELGVKKAQEPLLALLESEVPVLRRHALEALTRIGVPKKTAPRLFALLADRVADVRDAARLAIVSLGEEVVPLIRERIAHAPHEERRVLDAILADLGGKDAFTTLLAGLASGDAEGAKEAAAALRQQVKGAAARERRGYLAETERFLAKQAKEGAAASVLVATLKVMGYLEDERATETLLAYAADAKRPATVRQEAFIALRFCLGADRKDEPRVAAALLEAAEGDDRALAQTALHTLGSLALPSSLIKRAEKLAGHADFERARFVLEMLGRQDDPQATRALVAAARTLERRRADVAIAALGSKEDAVTPLAEALVETSDPDRAWLLRNVLRPSAKKVPPALRKRLLDEAISRLADGARGWEALLDVARDGDPEGVVTALRALATRLRRAKNDEKAAAVLGLLCKTEGASNDDRYALASLELARGPKDTRPPSRQSDESLKMLASLLARGFDVAGALRKDKALELDALYYVGFHFAEARANLGEELLAEVVKKGGRTKVGKMARNKLALLQGAAGGDAEAEAD